MTLAQDLNKEHLAELRDRGEISHGLSTLINEINKVQRYNADHTDKVKFLEVYFNYVTNNRVMAHLIIEADPDSNYQHNELIRLCVWEAGYRLYDNVKDGYQVNGGGYNKIEHVLDFMIRMASRYITIEDRSLFKARRIS